MPSVEVLILLSGPVAGGKSSLRGVFVEEYGFEAIRSSDYLAELARSSGRGISRTVLQNLGDELDARTDFQWLLENVARPTILGKPAQRRWLIDAVRKEKQVQMFRDEFGDAVLHVHVRAAEKVLRRRYEARAKADPALMEQQSYELAVAHENEQSARRLILVADIVVDTFILDSRVAAKAIAGRALSAGQVAGV